MSSFHYLSQLLPAYACTSVNAATGSFFSVISIHFPSSLPLPLTGIAQLFTSEASEARVDEMISCTILFMNIFKMAQSSLPFFPLFSFVLSDVQLHYEDDLVFWFSLLSLFLPFFPMHVSVMSLSQTHTKKVVRDFFVFFDKSENL